LVAALVIVAAAIGGALGAFVFQGGGTSVAAGRTPGGHEGIKVHGHWAIDVRSHGRLVSRTRFENSLDGSHPANFLAEILGRHATPGLWQIVVTNNTGSGQAPCTPDTGSGTPQACLLKEPAQTTDGQFSPDNVGSFKVLTVTPPDSLFDDKPLKLSGAFTATADGKIAEVFTDLWECPGTTAPSSPCQVGYDPTFTIRDLNSGGGPGTVNVTSGQQVLVTVNISFS